MNAKVRTSRVLLVIQSLGSLSSTLAAYRCRSDSTRPPQPLPFRSRLPCLVREPPASEWIVNGMPELAIDEKELWERVHARLGVSGRPRAGRSHDSNQSESPSSCERSVSAPAPVTGRDLLFAEAVSRVNIHQRYSRHAKSLEPEHRRYSTPDRSVILLDDILEVLARSNDDRTPRRVPAAREANAHSVAPYPSAVIFRDGLF